MEDEYDFSKSSRLKTALIVDFMSIVRKINTTQCQIFKDILEKLWSIIYNSCTFQRLDIIYDSYIEQSIKFSERQRRAVTNDILVSNIECSSYIPSQFEKFWASDRNKENLQLISRSFFIEKASENSKCLTLIGDSDTCNGIQCIQYKYGITSNKENLDKPLDEPDPRIIPHIEDSIQSKNTRTVLLSNDKDVLVLVLYFMQYFTSIGLKELWIQFGTGQNKRFIPVHKLSYKLGPHMCSNLLKAHILTGSDTTSKIGTKAAGIKCG